MYFFFMQAVDKFLMIYSDLSKLKINDIHWTILHDFKIILEIGYQSGDNVAQTQIAVLRYPITFSKACFMNCFHGRVKPTRLGVFCEGLAKSYIWMKPTMNHSSSPVSSKLPHIMYNKMENSLAYVIAMCKSFYWVLLRSLFFFYHIARLTLRLCFELTSFRPSWTPYA